MIIPNFVQSEPVVGFPSYPPKVLFGFLPNCSLDVDEQGFANTCSIRR